MTNHTISNDSRTISAVDKSCAILDGLHELRSATLTELADHLGLTPGTIHPHLVTLYENQLVAKKNGTYYPGFKFLRVGETRRRENIFYGHASNKIEDLAEATNTRVQIYVEEFGVATCIGQRGSPNSILPLDKVGDQVHLHVIAAGKAMLAEFADDRVEEIIEKHGLPEYTESTIVDEAELYEDLSEVSEQGYAVNDEEHMEGLSAVGAAITAENGDVIGALSVAFPASKMGDSEFMNMIPHDVVSAANTIELEIRVENRK
ncbi:IclR family transcriptional regulator [Natrinema gelatinilyticum]|uniref:IclR family transcriptional regulator n=1 Tax=Natrinema gelatinilyticum TaxID=2961571 RepID=UPI0020C21D2A|nr:IclR family transcriptional regulator [Natrinema gelatinilyticum]